VGRRAARRRPARRDPEVARCLALRRELCLPWSDAPALVAGDGGRTTEAHVAVELIGQPGIIASGYVDLTGGMARPSSPV